MGWLMPTPLWRAPLTLRSAHRCPMNARRLAMISPRSCPSRHQEAHRHAAQQQADSEPEEGRRVSEPPARPRHAGNEAADAAIGVEARERLTKGRLRPLADDVAVE